MIAEVFVECMIRISDYRYPVDVSLFPTVVAPGAANTVVLKREPETRPDKGNAFHLCSSSRTSPPGWEQASKAQRVPAL